MVISVKNFKNNKGHWRRASVGSEELILAVILDCLNQITAGKGDRRDQEMWWIFGGEKGRHSLWWYCELIGLNIDVVRSCALMILEDDEAK